jgi:3-deoxy-D-manno-octulosonic-acid transferase
LLEAFSRLRPRQLSARLLLCPHHPGGARTAWILAQARRRGIAALPWRGEPFQADANCVIVERLGVLADLYLLGALAYVGGGLSRGGVHAVIEPAACALPVIVGPRGHAEDVTRLIQAGGAAALPRGSAVTALRRLWDNWLDDPPARQAAGLAARGTLGTGAATRTATRLLELIPES